jgi:N-acyl-D-aspartate/D-glutamate deacylase
MFPNPNDEAATASLMRSDSTVLSTNDTGAHLLLVCNAGTTYLLQHWVRERQALTLEEAIFLITGRQALTFGLCDRGFLQPGKAADVVLLDPARVGLQAPDLVTDIPGGGMRYVQRGVGYERVIVNGRTLLVDGEPTGELSGMFLSPSGMSARSTAR